MKLNFQDTRTKSTYKNETSWRIYTNIKIYDTHMYYKICQHQKINHLNIKVYTYVIVMMERILYDFTHENIILFKGNTRK